jgi:hypothetical protein
MKQFKITFVWSSGFDIIEAKDLTQAKRIASRRYGKWTVRGIREVKCARQEA